MLFRSPWLDEATATGCRRQQSFLYQGAASVLAEPETRVRDLEEGDILMLDNRASLRFAALILQDPVKICGLSFWRTQISSVAVAIYNETDTKTETELEVFKEQAEDAVSDSVESQVEVAVAALEAAVAYIHINRVLVVDNR